MIQPDTQVFYKNHRFTVICLINRGSYVTALLKGYRGEVPLEQLREVSQ